MIAFVVNFQQEISDQDTGSSFAQDSSQTGNDETSASHASETQTVSSASPVEQDTEVDYVHTAAWRQQRKHFFILSEAGKPIYCR